MDMEEKKLTGQTEREWRSNYFGQSTSEAKNFVVENADGSVTITARQGGGKVTGDHDGITFHYTEINAETENFELSATIQVQLYAKTPHDGQESFGIMARDAIGQRGDGSVFASNIAAIGGFAGDAGAENGLQLFARTGIKAPDGSGSKGLQKIMLESGKPAGTFRLTLKKTNSGFIGKVNDGREEILYEPDILNVQDSTIYLGFYTARLATIEVRDIALSVTEAATDAPRVEAPPVMIVPSCEIVSPAKTPLDQYDFRFRANVDGHVTVLQEGEVLVKGLAIKMEEEVMLSAVLAKGHTHFSVSFLPDHIQTLSSYSSIMRGFTVERREYSGDILVSPNGTAEGEGTVASPLDLDTAIQFVKPGQTVLLADGVYQRTTPLHIEKYNDGAEGDRKRLAAAPDARPVLDFGRRTRGGVLSGNYWHIKGIDFAHSAGDTPGFQITGNHNIIERSRFYGNGDTGLLISHSTGNQDPATWPSDNLILNCDSFDNRDPSDNNADGFAAKVRSGSGNVFRGCIAYNNIDDGWDLYTKVGSGAIGAVLIEDCIAYRNGFVSYDPDGRGDGNGFKLGGEGIHVPHTIRNSLAFENLAYGFTSNSNPGVRAERNVAFNNVEGNLSLTTFPRNHPDFAIDGFLSCQKDYTGEDTYPENLVSDQNYFFDGNRSINRLGIPLTEANFTSLTLVPYERDEEGNIIRGSFLAFLPPDNEYKK